jgi:hypothetical protein
MTYKLSERAKLLLERRAAELGLTPSAYLERLVELDASGDAVEEAIPGTTIPELHSEPVTAEKAKAMARGSVFLFRLWGVTDDQAAKLLNLSVSEYCCWKGGEFGIVDRDTAARLSNLVGIQQSLARIFLDPGRAYAWVKVPNLIFRGRTALDVMLDGDLPALIRMRRFLDAQPRWEEYECLFVDVRR